MNLKNNLNENKSYGIQRVISIRDFRRLWIGQIFSQLADKFYIVLMVYLIAEYWATSNSDNNQIVIGMTSAINVDFASRIQKITILATGIYVANTIPAIIFGIFAGLAADQWKKKNIMIFSNILRALLLLLAPLTLIKGPEFMGIGWGYFGLITMTFIESSLTQFFSPAEQAIIPLLIPKQHLLAANSLYQATSMGAMIIGFALGNPIIKIFKSSFNLLGINGGEFLLLPVFYGIAALLISTIKFQENLNSRKHHNFWEEINTGLKILKSKSAIRGAILHLVMLYSLLAALYVLSISLSSSIKELGPTSFGVLLAISGLGMAIGALGIAQIGHNLNRKKISTYGLGVITISLVLIANFTGKLSLTLFACGLLGIGSALVAIPAQTIIQEETPEPQRGKVFGLQNNLINIALSLPLVIAGTLVSNFGLLPIIWLLSAIALFATVLERPWQRC